MTTARRTTGALRGLPWGSPARAHVIGIAIDRRPAEVFLWAQKRRPASDKSAGVRRVMWLRQGRVPAPCSRSRLGAQTLLGANWAGQVVSQGAGRVIPRRFLCCREGAAWRTVGESMPRYPVGPGGGRERLRDIATPRPPRTLAGRPDQPDSTPTGATEPHAGRRIHD